MRKNLISRTDLMASEICLGTGLLGSVTIPDDNAFNLLDLFVENGGNFIDSANIYSDWITEIKGKSELTIGSWLLSRQCRKDMIVCTKGGSPRKDRIEVRAEDITLNIDDSLERLQTDYIDLYVLHRDDPQVPIPEIMDALFEAKQKGKIRWYGASNWSLKRLNEAENYALSSGIPAMAVSQNWYSLIMPVEGNYGDDTLAYIEAKEIEFHRESGMSVMAYSSQAGGFLKEEYKDIMPDDLDKLYGTPHNYNRLGRARELAAELGRTANQIALAYLLNQDFSVFPIIGSRTPEQLLNSCDAAKILLTPDQIKYLEGVD